VKIRTDEAAGVLAAVVLGVVLAAALLTAAPTTADETRAEDPPEALAPLAVAPPGACPEPSLRSLSPSPDDFAISGRPVNRFVAAQVAADVQLPPAPPQPAVAALPRRNPCDDPGSGCTGTLLASPPEFEEPPVVPVLPPGIGP
jgi:hypothetical protein